MSIQIDELKSWTEEVLARWGYAAHDAAFLADTLVDANARGIDSHGVLRLPAYEKRIIEGLVRADAKPVVSSQGSVVKVDANGAAGQLATRAAAERALEISRTSGVASAVVRNSTHFGTAGYFARWLAERDAVALVVSNAEPNVVPHGGKEALLGTNPIAFAAPAHDAPISLDMATSTSAMGKVLLAQATGEAIPPTWGVDELGRPTTDAMAIKALLPAAGPKGYGLGFLVEILSGVLTGAAISHQIGNIYSDLDRPQDVGHWILVLDVASFLPVAEFKNRLQYLVDLAHGTAPAVGVNSVLVPGEPEERTKAERMRTGIPLPNSTLHDLRNLGERCGVAFPLGDAR